MEEVRILGDFEFPSRRKSAGPAKEDKDGGGTFCG